MEAITILRELWRLRYLVFLGAILALAIALMTAYRISLAPPKLESRQYHVGAASARVLIDTPDSQVVDLNPKGADVLSARATLLANLMASTPVKAVIARDAGVPANQLVAVAPSSTGPTAPTALSKATSEHASVAQTYILTVQADETLPIIAVTAQAPNAEQAARLANAASTGLRDYLHSVAGAQNVPAGRQVVISSLGAAQSADVVKGPSRLLALVAFVLIFGLACFGVIMISGLARGWRRAAALERSGGVDAPTPRDGGTSPSAAQSLRRRSWPGRTPTGGERSAAADERLAG